MNSLSLDQLRKELQKPLDHPDWPAAEEMGLESIRWLIRHHSTLAHQPIGKTGSRKQMEELLREPVPEKGQAFSKVLAEFQDKIAVHAFKTNHPRFLAFI